MKTAINFLKLSFTLATLFLASNQQAIAQTAVFAKETSTIIDQKVGEYTESGALIISDYTENIAITKNGEKFGLVNKQGYEISQAEYDEIRPFEQGMAAVRIQNKWTFVNKQGQRISTLRFDWVANFHNGAAAVQSEGKWGLMGEQGFLITPIKYDRVGHFEKGTAPVKSGEKWLYVNERGEEMSIAVESLLQVSGLAQDTF